MRDNELKRQAEFKAERNKRRRLETRLTIYRGVERLEYGDTIEFTCSNTGFTRVGKVSSADNTEEDGPIVGVKLLPSG